MRLHRFEDINQFYPRVEPFLLAREAQHCLMLGLCTTLMKANIYEQPPYLACVEDQGEVVAVALRTPPHFLILSEVKDSSPLSLVVKDAYDLYPDLQGITGPTESCRLFAEYWGRLTEQRFYRAQAMRLYRQDVVQSVKNVSGQPDIPGEADRETLTRWWMAFAAEALMEEISPEVAERNVKIRLEGPAELRGLRVWRDQGEVVSLVGYGGLTPNGIRIGPVYTPPELRGRGYASALTASVSQEMFDRGRKFCFLFTDLNNPTSNHIYQEIGYRPVMDADTYHFEGKS